MKVSQSRVTILVKASPQPSKTYSETVCCAGLEPDGTWRRLFPIRFRRLQGEQSFNRWDTVKFNYSRPKTDSRPESCRVHEESIRVTGKLKDPNEKSALVERAVMGSEKEAAENGHSLALVRPTDVSLSWAKKSRVQIGIEKDAFAAQAAQLSLLENEIATYEPCPYEFKLTYRDADGLHKKSCADWETSAAFYNLRKSYSEAKTLEHLQKAYCETYVRAGLVLALGNMQKRPQTWQLLGIFPVERSKQPDLF